MTRVRRLLRVGLNVSDLAALAGFYEAALGFEIGPEQEADAALCRLLGARRLRLRRLRLGAQEIELTQADPPGAAYPAGTNAADLVFQHFAIATPDIGQAYQRLAAFAPAAISRAGPVHLPRRSGGVTAFKFRDPDGHPLELLQFPQPRPPGVDHSAIALADAARGIAFYDSLGLRVLSRQRNAGAEQDALDGLDGAVVDVVGLATQAETPHVELLGYHHPLGRPAPDAGATAIAASRLVCQVDGAGQDWPALVRDPDGHRLVLVMTSDGRGEAWRGTG